MNKNNDEIILYSTNFQSSLNFMSSLYLIDFHRMFPINQYVDVVLYRRRILTFYKTSGG